MPTTGAEPPAPPESAPPRLATARLVLRRLEAGDAAAIEQLAGDWEVAKQTSHIPHPYPPGAAAAWLASRQADRDDPLLWGIERPGDGLVGCIELRRTPGAPEGEVGYWIGRPYWGQGLVVEALRAVIDLAFDTLGLVRVWASARPDNPASIRVQEKLGFRFIDRDVIAAPARGGAMPVERRRLTPADRAAAWPLPPRGLVLVVAAALIDPDGRVLLARRPPGKPMAGLWEFPGGKVNPGETPEAALIRELAEELGIDVGASCLAPFAFASHRYRNFHLLMPLYACRVWQGTVTPREGQELAWVRPARLGDYPMPPADKPLVAQVRDLL
jgi:8-oxo-dGTP diphosphatase